MSAPDEPNLTEIKTSCGIIIRDLRAVDSPAHSSGYSFRFQGLIGNTWMEFGPVCTGDTTLCHDRPGYLPLGWSELDGLEKALRDGDFEDGE